MRLQGHALDLATGRRINHRQAAITKTDDDALGRGVDTDVIGIAAELESSRRLLFVSLEQPYRTIPRVCDEERIDRRLIADARGTFNPGMVRIRLRFARSTTPTLSLPS
jgi:hypothetical protein